MSRLFSALVCGVAILFAVRIMERRRLNALKEVKEEYFDYIIVGAGSAGAVLAARLSAESSVNVLLLEAGGHEKSHPDGSVPWRAGNLQNSDVDWGYRTVPQKNACKAMHNQQSAWPRGKILGGSSVLNYMVYVRGSRHDYDRWEKEEGCEGWGYKDVLPFFMKSQDQRNKTLQKTDYHSSGQFLVVTDTVLTPVSDFLYNAYAEVGVAPTDINGQNQLGYMHSQVTIRDGNRCSTSYCILRPTMEINKNLRVITHAHVNKVLIENKRAVGVQYIKDNKLREVKARREVILCAGAIGTPQLLMLSGIGPKKHLEELGIPVVSDLPVGQNLQDHVMADIVAFLVDKPVSITDTKAESFFSHFRYWLTGGGYLSSAGGDEGCAFVKSKNQPKEAKEPYLQIQHFASPTSLPPQYTNMKEELWDALHRDTIEKEGFGGYPTLTRPYSKGYIKLKSANPFEYPILEPMYLSDKRDVNILIEGIRFLRGMANTTFFKKIGATLHSKVLPSCAHHEFDTDAYWECHVRHVTLTVYHQCCTARMGNPKDKSTVVDPKLRVKGVEGLRVADASVMPSIVAGNINAPVVMIGERAAQILRDTITARKAVCKEQ